MPVQHGTDLLEDKTSNMPFIKDIMVRTKKVTETFNNLYTWGRNFSGELGTNDEVSRSSPVFITSNVEKVSASGHGFSHFIKSGGLYGMGTNSYGTLGDGTTISRKSPVQIGSQTYWYFVANNRGYGAHSLFLSDQAGSTKLWVTGFNGSGELGLGDTTNRSSPVQVGTETDWIYAAAGSSYSLAIRLIANSAGTLWAWGTNFAGQLGLGDTTTRSSPVQVGNGTDWIVVATGETHTLALANTGTDLYVWGNNANGQLGLGTNVSHSSPVLLASDGYLSISSGFYFSGAVKTDGTLWMWGYNNVGQLGLGDTTQRNSPVQVGAGTNWHAVRCGTDHTVAMKTDGTIWAWGSNSQGGLGDGTTTNRSSPVQIGSLTSWKIAQEIFEGYNFDAGINFSMAIETP